MSAIYCTTINGKTVGRASYFFRSEKTAGMRCNDQNDRASAMGIKARYQVASTDDKGIEKKDIRD